MAEGNNIGKDIMLEVLPRVGHVAVAVHNSMIVWGGYRDDVTALSEKYLSTDSILVYHTDLDLGYWTKHETTGETPPGTSGAAAVLVENEMYVFAGHTDLGNTNELYVLDLKLLEWKRVRPDSPMPSPRDKFALWLYDNKLYCFGGFGPKANCDFLNEHGQFILETGTPWQRQREWNNQLVVYDIQTNTWSNPKCKGTVPLPRAAHAAVRMKDKCYIFGGRHGNTRMNDLHCIDLDTLTWSGELYIEGVCPCGRSWHSFTAVSDDTAFLYGGYSTEGIPLGDAWQLNVTTHQWSEITVVPDKPRLWHTCCYTADGELLVFGGCENDILNWEIDSEQSNEVLKFQLQPFRLQRICLQVVYKVCTSEKWTVLPKPLHEWLKRRKALEQHKLCDKHEADHTLRHGTTCAVS